MGPKVARPSGQLDPPLPDASGHGSFVESTNLGSTLFIPPVRIFSSRPGPGWLTNAKR
jgi:hypothetical protein